MIKKAIIELPPYEVPQKALIKLNQNESPYDIPEAYKNEILAQLKKIPWNRYPPEVPEELKKALADYTSHPPEGIVIGDGSNELILASMLATCDKGDSITVVRPGFAIYPYLARILQLKVKEVRLRNDFSFDVEGLLRCVRGSKAVYIATPNNPTGTAIELSGIEKILQMKKAMVIIDEAYYEFHGKTAQGFLFKYPNLLILRTFSKAFGLAGVRLGYMLCHPDVAKQISKAKLPFSVGIFQINVANFLLRKKRLVNEIVKKIIGERERVFEQLNSIPKIIPIPSRANFILFGVKDGSAECIFKKLYEKDILVRKFNHPDLNNMLRVTIGKPLENQIFLKELARITGGLDA
ncbi:MAG: histidinol-phosphate transaminase [candidate division WOR-3 bacterium]|nr:histidinol-phosphate transaminase [candidate division WOR-3 bacterium]